MMDNNEYNVIDISGKSSSPNDIISVHGVVGNYSIETRKETGKHIWLVPSVILNTIPDNQLVKKANRFEVHDGS